MRLGIDDSEAVVFRRAMQSITKFMDKAHFEIDGSGIRIRSIDPHDFCYADLSFGRSFFNGEFDGNRTSFGLDLSKLGQILPTLSRAKSLELHANDETMELNAITKWKLSYRIGSLTEDAYRLPEPKKFSYEAIVQIPAEDFTSLIDAASAVSKELVFTIRNGTLTVTATSGSYDFAAKPTEPIHIRSAHDVEISEHVLASYLRPLRPLIEKCNTVRVLLGRGKPVQFDLLYGEKAVFSFALSPKKLRLVNSKRQSRDGSSLPRITATRFPDFVMYLASSPRGESTKMLESAGLETSGGDYSRLASALGMVNQNRGNLEITMRGLQFANLMKSSSEAARLHLHKAILERVPAYPIMIGQLRHRPMSVEDLFRAINISMKKKGKLSIDKQDLSTLLGLAAWCGMIDRKLAVYYFGKGGRSE
jgi:hypothetical protein